MAVKTYLGSKFEMIRSASSGDGGEYFSSGGREFCSISISVTSEVAVWVVRSGGDEDGDATTCASSVG